MSINEIDTVHPAVDCTCDHCWRLRRLFFLEERANPARYDERYRRGRRREGVQGKRTGIAAVSARIRPGGISPAAKFGKPLLCRPQFDLDRAGPGRALQLHREVPV